MTDQDGADLLQRIAGWRTHLKAAPSQLGFPPSSIVSHHLAQLVDPSEVIYVEWASGEGSGMDLTSGSLFALVPGHALQVGWTDIPTDQNIHQRPTERQKIEMVFHPLAKRPTLRLEMRRVHPQYSSTDIGVVTVEGDGWKQSLPLNTQANMLASAFLRDVRQALDKAFAVSDGPVAAG